MPYVSAVVVVALVVVGKGSEPAASKEPAGADVAKLAAAGLTLVESELSAAEEALVVGGKVSEVAASKEPAGADVAKSAAVGMKLVESEVSAA